MKYDKWHFPQLSHTVLFSLQRNWKKKIKQSTRTRNKVWKPTVLVLNAKQEVLCSNPGKKKTQQTYFEAKWEALFQEVSQVITKEEPCFQSEIFEGCFLFAWLADHQPTILRGKAVPKIPSKGDEVTTFKLFFMHRIQTSFISPSHTTKTTHRHRWQLPATFIFHISQD